MSMTLFIVQVPLGMTPESITTGDGPMGKSGISQTGLQESLFILADVSQEDLEVGGNGDVTTSTVLCVKAALLV